METGDEILDRVIAFGGSGDLAGSGKGGMMRETDADGGHWRAGGHGGRRDTTNFRHGGLGHFPLSNPIVHPSAERIAFRETKTARRQGRRLVAKGFVMLDCLVDNVKMIMSTKNIVHCHDCHK